jgi:hypothetical protein
LTAALVLSLDILFPFRRGRLSLKPLPAVVLPMPAAHP